MGRASGQGFVGALPCWLVPGRSMRVSTHKENGQTPSVLVAIDEGTPVARSVGTSFDFRCELPNFPVPIQIPFFHEWRQSRLEIGLVGSRTHARIASMMAALPCSDETEDESDVDSHDMADPFTPAAEGSFVVESQTPQKHRTTVADCFQATPRKRRIGDVYDLESAPDDAKSLTLAHQRLSMGELFPTSPRASAPSASASTTFVAKRSSDPSPMMQWHPNRWFELALETYFACTPAPRRRRQRTKGPDWSRLLLDLARDPRAEMHTAGTHRERRTGYQQYAKTVAQHTGQTSRCCRKDLYPLWSRASRFDQWKWYLLALAHSQQPASSTLATKRRDQAVAARPKPPPVRVEQAAPQDAHFTRDPVVGLSATYNTELGLCDSEVLSWVTENFSSQELIKKMQGHELHTLHFHKFWEFWSTLAEDYGFKTVGACLELSENASRPGRVHLHGFMGTDIRGGHMSMTSVVRAVVPRERLTFAGRRPHVKVCKPRRPHPKTVFDVIVLGHYYVVAKKTSTIFRRSTMWPIQEADPALRSFCHLPR